jgi:Mitochondrial biogenesis AIM24
VREEILAFSLRGMLSGEGLFLLTVEGSGLLPLSSFGAIHSKTLGPGEEYIVDTGHIVAFEGSVGYPIEGDRKDAGGWRVSQRDGPVGPLRRGLRLSLSGARQDLHSDPATARLRSTAPPPSFPSRVPGADRRDRSDDILSGGCEAERCKLVENLGVEVGNGRTDRAGRGSHPVHLSQMIGGPRGQGCAERLGGGHGDQTVIWPFQLAQHGVQPLERPGHLGAGGITGQAEAGDVLGLVVQAMEPAGGTSGDVDETPGIEPHQIEQAIDAADPELGEIGQVRSQVRRADGGQAEHSFSPQRVGKQSPGVHASHAVADDVNRFLGKAAKDPITQSPGAKLHSGDRMDPRHQDTVPRRAKFIRNPPEVGRERQRTQTDP